MSSEDKVRATKMHILATSPVIVMSRIVFESDAIDCTSCRRRLCARRCNVSWGPWLIFIVGKCVERVYTIGRLARHIHGRKVSGDAVGNRVLRQGRSIVRGGFSGGAVVRKAAKQRWCERGMSCGESPRYIG